MTVLLAEDGNCIWRHGVLIYSAQMWDNANYMSKFVWKLINLRKEMKAEIKTTTYLTHGLHNYYPAKFIPQVPRFVIQHLGITNKVILDPFAGSGTTAVECLVTGNSNISNDLNPLTGFLIDLKTLHLDSFQNQKHSGLLEEILVQLEQSQVEYLPNWENVAYWYPPEILPVICRIWGGIYKLDSSYAAYIPVIKAAALYVSRRFSYDEDDSPKLFRSKYKKIKMVEILEAFQQQRDNLIFAELRVRARTYLNGVMQFNQIVPSKYTIAKKWSECERGFVLKINGSVEKLPDVLPANSVDCVVTSPPYMYAQEYFRSTKLDMYWLNMIDDQGVRALTKAEIGQRMKSALDLTDELNSCRHYVGALLKVRANAKNFKTKTNLPRFEAYFGDMLAFIKVSKKLVRRRGHVAILIGEPKVFGQPIPARKIFSELMEMQGLVVDKVFFDTIKSRQLSLGRANSNPDGMPGEWLIIGHKP